MAPRRKNHAHEVRSRSSVIRNAEQLQRWLRKSNVTLRLNWCQVLEWRQAEPKLFLSDLVCCAEGAGSQTHQSASLGILRFQDRKRQRGHSDSCDHQAFRYRSPLSRGTAHKLRASGSPTSIRSHQFFTSGKPNGKKLPRNGIIVYVTLHLLVSSCSQL